MVTNNRLWGGWLNHKENPRRNDIHIRPTWIFASAARRFTESETVNSADGIVACVYEKPETHLARCVQQ